MDVVADTAINAATTTAADVPIDALAYANLVPAPVAPATTAADVADFACAIRVSTAPTPLLLLLLPLLTLMFLLT